jgi:hypothetical protein
MDKITTPILIIAFNRPDVTAKIFEYIRAGKPENFFGLHCGYWPR